MYRPLSGRLHLVGTSQDTAMPLSPGYHTAVVQLPWSSPRDTEDSRPATCLTFLGITVDTEDNELRLPADKLAKLKTLLTEWGDRKACSRRERARWFDPVDPSCEGCLTFSSPRMLGAPEEAADGAFGLTGNSVQTCCGGKHSRSNGMGHLSWHHHPGARPYS